MAIYAWGLLLLAASRLTGALNPTFSDTVLNVHLVPHTHDDPGWLKTVDQCYYGANNTIQQCGVQYILDTVLQALLDNPDRTFIYAEQSFFQRWWNEQSFAKKQAFRSLVESGRMEFVNGGWVMHDEAASHFVSMIDQTTYGHRFLKEQFNVKPKIGWQIDPFGHSSTHAALLSAEVGFDALYFGRIDYQDHDKRMAEKNLEFVWRASPSLGPEAEVFTGAFQSGNYVPPPNLCFDQAHCRDAPVMDDERLEDYNVDWLVDTFVEAANELKRHARGNHVIMNMGSDFHYENAHAWYRNLDKLIDYVNKDGRVNTFYSTMSIYTQAKHSENIDWSLKTDDFFPYADCDHCYWTGYFTSRPTLKGFERYSSSFLQGLKQLSVLSGKHAEQEISALTGAVGLCNHHDAITGTSKQHVAYDYTKILDKALTNAEEAASKQLARLAFQAPAEAQQEQLNLDEQPLLQQCRLMNESVCDATTQVTSGSIAVVVYNQLPRARSQQVTVLLSSSDAAVLLDGRTPIRSQIFPAAKSTVTDTTGIYNLVFTAENVPALGVARYVVLLKAAGAHLRAESSTIERLELGIDARFTASNDIYLVQFSQKDGSIVSVSRRDKDVNAQLKDGVYYYVGYGSPGVAQVELDEAARKEEAAVRAMASEEKKHSHYSLGIVKGSSNPSGAYIFRPSHPDETATPVVADTTLEIIRGAEVTEVRRYTSGWASSIVRLRKGSDLIEYQWNVGPVDVDDGKGKEVIVRFDTNLKSDAKHWTDSNGREFLMRIRNYRPTWNLIVHEPISGNYYPITAASYLVDESAGTQFTVLTDRSQAMGSIQDGSVEVMIHRRLLADDWRGVEEPLDETDGGISPYPDYVRSGDGIKVTGTLFLHLDAQNTAMSAVRPAMDRLFLPSMVAYGGEEAARLMKITAAASSGIGYELPTNVHLLTLQPWAPNTILVRLAHQFAVDEDAVLSAPVTVDLAQLLEPLGGISEMSEMSLSANQERAEMEANRLRWSSVDPSSSSPRSETASSTEGCQVTINPMEIKTFIVKLA